jgi:hypothetical protein
MATPTRPTVAVGAGGEDVPMNAHEILRYATDQLHSIRPQPAPILIAQVLYEIKAKLMLPPEVEDPPKDFADAVSKIEAKIGKMEHPPKVKPDFKPILEAAKPVNEKKAS